MKARPIYWATIAVQIYFVLAVLIAILVYPHYQITEQFLSALGTTNYGWIFNSAVILLGAVSYPFYFQFYQQRKSKEALITLVLGEISAVQLLGIGLFVSDGATSKLHDIFAISLFLLFVPLGLLLSYCLWSTHRTESYLGIIFSITTIIGLFVPGVNQYVMQKVIVGVYVTFLLLFSVKQLDT